MKVVLLSNAPWSITGYGNQCRILIPQLQKLGHEPAVVAFYGLEGGVINADGVPIYPRGANPWGLDVIDAHATHFNKRPGGLVISLMDSWVLDAGAFRHTRWAPLFPIDHEPCPPPILVRVRNAWARIVYSRFGERMMHDAGLDCYYAPHMINTDIHKPQGKRQARDFIGLPQDAFVVGMVAANKGNPSRKCFQQQLEAFKVLHDKHPDTWLHLHTAKGENGGGEAVNLPELIDYLGLTACTSFAEPYSYFKGIPDEGVATVYNAFDVLTSVSMGEGFGIPIVEAQANGVPVIVGDWTSMSELCFGGWMIDKADSDKLWTPLGAYQFVPRVGAIADAMETAYQAAGSMTISKKARKGAMQYNADDVAETYWRPVLADMQRRIEAEDATPTFEQMATVKQPLQPLPVNPNWKPPTPEQLETLKKGVTDTLGRLETENTRHEAELDKIFPGRVRRNDEGGAA